MAQQSTETRPGMRGSSALVRPTRPTGRANCSDDTSFRRVAMTSSVGTFEQFLLWERASRDTLEVKRLYVDMAGDLVAGVMLSQIIYWHLPNRDGYAKLQVQREGKRWLAKGRADWWEE